jgi:glycosyltransferase involved in cell wall biosynthesis
MDPTAANAPENAAHANDSARVLMFCNQFRPIVGGAERQAERLARALLARNAHVVVLTPQLDAAWPTREVIDGLEVRRFPLPDLPRRFGIRGLGPANLLLQRACTRRALREQLPEFDVVHAHLASNLVTDIIAPAHALGKPVVCKVACGGERFDFDKIRGTSIFGGLLVRQLVAGIDCWIAISSEVRADLVAAGVSDSRIVSIPNGVDLAEHPARKVEAPVRRFLYLGRSSKCDLASLIDAFDRLLAKEPECDLRIVGAGAGEAVPPQLSRHPRAAARIRWDEYAPAAEALAWADALVLPTRAEGLSNSLLEAMARGLPCVVSHIAPNREVVDGGRCGLLAPLGDPEAWAAELLRLAGDQGLAARLGSAARARIEQRYAIGRVAEQCLELYARMRSGEPPGQASVPAPAGGR